MITGGVTLRSIARAKSRKRLDEVPVQRFNTPRGTIGVSTPEATALDLVGYQHHAGGLSQVATVLAELAEKIDPERIVKAFSEYMNHDGHRITRAQFEEILGKMRDPRVFRGTSGRLPPVCHRG